MLFKFVRCLLLSAFVLFSGLAAGAQSPPHIAILGALPPLTDSADAENAAAVLKRDGFAPEIVTPEQIANPQFFTPSRFAALIAPHCRLFPAMAQANLLAYLRGQGKLLCVGGPAFERYAYRENGVWKLRDRLSKPLAPALASVKAPDLPTISPPNQVFHIGSEIAGAWLPVARERGIGFAGDRPGRLLPADGRGSETEYSPEVRKRQWGYLILSGPMRGAIWALNPKVNPPNEPTFTPLTALLKRILQGVYLVKAGAELPCYSVNQPVGIGAEWSNFGAARKVSAEIEIRGFGDQAFQKFITRSKETLAAGGLSGYNETLQGLPTGSYLVRVTLFEENGTAEDDRPVLDRLTAPFRVLPSPDPSTKSPITIAKSGKEFLRDGKPFTPKAVDFAPAWTAGQNEIERKRGWLSAEQYDPELITQDLTAAVKSGANVLRVTYRHSDEAPALRGFLAQCQSLNLLADIVIEETDAQNLTALLEAAQITRNPAVFGIEISEDFKAGRKRFTQEWRRSGLLIGRGFASFRNIVPLNLKLSPGAAGLDFLVICTKSIIRRQ